MTALAVGIGRTLPRGDQLLFTRDDYPNRGLWLLDTRNMVTARLTRDRHRAEDYGTWSPTGNQIVYGKLNQGVFTPCSMTLPRKSIICLEDETLSRIDNMIWSSDDLSVIISNSASYDEGFIYRWQPERSIELVFTLPFYIRNIQSITDEDYFLVSGINQTTFFIVAVWLDETPHSQILYELETPMDRFEVQAFPSPDGRTILLLRENSDRLIDLVSISTQDSFEQRLGEPQTHHIIEIEGISIAVFWSPDGQLLAYTFELQGNEGLFILDAASRTLVHSISLSHHFDLSQPAISASASWMAYVETDWSYTTYINATLYLQSLTEHTNLITITKQCHACLRTSSFQWRPR